MKDCPNLRTIKIQSENDRLYENDHKSDHSIRFSTHQKPRKGPRGAPFGARLRPSSSEPSVGDNVDGRDLHSCYILHTSACVWNIPHPICRTTLVKRHKMAIQHLHLPVLLNNVWGTIHCKLRHEKRTESVGTKQETVHNTGETLHVGKTTQNRHTIQQQELR